MNPGSAARTAVLRRPIKRMGRNATGQGYIISGTTRRLGQVVFRLDRHNALGRLLLKRAGNRGAHPVKLDGLDRVFHFIVRPAERVQYADPKLIVSDEGKRGAES